MRLLEMTVSAANGQVTLMVPDAEEMPPQWQTGHELVVANSGTIDVATRPYIDGEVIIEVWLGVEEPPHPHGEPIYDGILQVRDATALVGDLTGNHLGLVWLLPEGAHRVRVYTDPPTQLAEHVDFVID